MKRCWGSDHPILLLNRVDDFWGNSNRTIFMDNGNEKTDEVIKVYKRPLWLNLFLDAFFLAFGVVFAVEAVKACHNGQLT